MKKIGKSKLLIFIVILICSFFVVKTDVYAKEMTASEIPARSYVIGKYVFTREINEETGYNGALTTNLLMLASKSIESDDLKDMIVYYKLPSEDWIDGATGEELSAPETFNIEYIDLQKEEEDVVVPVEKPAAPIMYPALSPSSFNVKKGLFTYDIWFELDICEEGTVKIDGLEISHQDYLSRGHTEDIKASSFSACSMYNFDNVPDEYKDFIPKNLIEGRNYASEVISFATTPGDYYNLVAKTYVLDENGEKVYSDIVTYSANKDTNFPPVEIKNNYSNPKYIAETDDYYVYKLGIKKPVQEVYNGSDAKHFAYIVHEKMNNTSRQVGVYNLDEEFIVSVKKGNVVTYSAQLGYYDINGDFQYFMTSNNKYFTIDSRKLTAPILTYNPAAGYSGPGLSVNDIEQGEYIFTNQDFYKKASEDSLDYLVEGTEIYRVYGSTFELVSDKFGTAHVLPPFGKSYYVARVYATNAEGERVYSDFSEKVGVVRTPLLESSEVVDGKATITIKNIDDYNVNSPVTFALYKTNTGTGEDIKLDEITYSGNQEGKFEIEVTDAMEVYAVASSHDYENSSGLDPTHIYSCNSNGIDFNIE